MRLPWGAGWVQVGEHSACSTDIDMGVDLGRAQIGMAQHLLDGLQVRPVREQVGRERMPELVRRNPVGVGQPRRKGSLLDLQKGRSAGEGAQPVPHCVDYNLLPAPGRVSGCKAVILASASRTVSTNAFRSYRSL
jgi:hypothetical protein